MIQLTPRDISVILAVTTYYVLNRPQIQKLCFPNDSDGRITRKRVQGLAHQGYISRHSLFVFNAAPMPVYYPTRKGAELLASHFDDERFLAANTQCPPPHLLYHWIDINNTRLALEAALKPQTDVRVSAWYNEWEVVNKRETVPEKRFRIFTLIRENPRLVCAPDAFFVLTKGGAQHKAFFLEQDRNTTAAHQVVASKTPAYAAMQETNLHLRLYPTALPKFIVLTVTPSAERRDILRKTVKGKPGAERWRFVSSQDLKPESLLTAAIVYACEGEPTTLVKGN